MSREAYDCVDIDISVRSEARLDHELQRLRVTRDVERQQRDRERGCGLRLDNAIARPGDERLWRRRLDFETYLAVSRVLQLQLACKTVCQHP